MLLVSSVADATTNDLFGHGQRSQALAGTGAARSSAEDAGYDNPAHFSRARHNYFSIGYQASIFRLQAAQAQEVLHLDDASHGITMQLTVPIPLQGWMRDRVGLGVGAYLPSQLIARAAVPLPETPQFPLLARRAQALGFAAGLGVDVSHGFRLGAGFSALAEVLGNVSVGGGSSASTGSEILATFSPIIGASYDFGAPLSLGVVWRGEIVNEFDVGVSIQDLPLLTVPELRIAGVAHYDPMQVQAGVTTTLERVELALDATIKLWSRFTGWQRATIECPETSPDCDAGTAAPVTFTDTVVPRIGIAIPMQITPSARGELRTGYFFEPTPLPEQTGTSNYFDADRHALTLGYGIDAEMARVPLTANLAWQLHVLSPRTHHKVAPDGSPAPVETRGWIQMVSFDVGARF